MKGRIINLREHHGPSGSPGNAAVPWNSMNTEKTLKEINEDIGIPMGEMKGEETSLQLV